MFTAVGLICLAVVIIAFLKFLRRRRFVKIGRYDIGEGLIQGGWEQEMEITPFPAPAVTRGSQDLVPEVLFLDGDLPTQAHLSGQEPMEFPGSPPSYSGSLPPYRTNTSAASEVAMSEAFATAHSSPLGDDLAKTSLRI